MSCSVVTQGTKNRPGDFACWIRFGWGFSPAENMDAREYYEADLFRGRPYVLTGREPELESWIEKGIAPAAVVASHRTDGKVDRTRPLCPYPQVARYKGQGSIEDAASFECRMP